MRYRRADGGFAEATLDRLVPEDVADGLPVREFRSYKGRLHYSGLVLVGDTGAAAGI
ncbi:MAG TPA: hypothetical protein VIV12_19420 [Streptosporangiaceae bacterium]